MREINGLLWVPFKDFHGEMYPKAVERYGFKDTSWHNDSMGRLALDYPGGRISIWVDHENPTHREHAGPRFVIDRESGAGWEEEIWAGDSVQEMLNQAMLAAHAHIRF